LKPATVIAGYFVVAVAFFLVGRYAAPVRDGGLSVEIIGTAVEAPKLKTPRPKAPKAPVEKLRLEQVIVAPAAAAPAGDQDQGLPPGVVPSDDPSPSKGSPRAKVIVLEVSDFQCPVCRRAYEPLRKLHEEFPGEVLLVFKQNPLKMHRNALGAAVASMAAARQGKFWEYADTLFANQRALSEAELKGHARTVGLDMARFEKDFADDGLKARALAEGAAASELGARGTPAFFVNGKKQVGWASYQAVKQQVSREIQKVNGLLAKGMSLKAARLQRVKDNLPDPGPMLSTPLGREFQSP